MISTELERIRKAKTDIRTAIEAKGVAIPADALIDTFPSKIEEIQTGGGTGVKLNWEGTGYSEKEQKGAESCGNITQGDIDYMKHVLSLYNPSVSTNLVNITQNDDKLVLAPKFDITSRSATTFNMFQGCSNLVYIPEYIFKGSSGGLGSMEGCDKLKRIEKLSTVYAEEQMAQGEMAVEKANSGVSVSFIKNLPELEYIYAVCGDYNSDSNMKNHFTNLPKLKYLILLGGQMKSPATQPDYETVPMTGYFVSEAKSRVNQPRDWKWFDFYQVDALGNKGEEWEVKVLKNGVLQTGNIDLRLDGVKYGSISNGYYKWRLNLGYSEIDKPFEVTLDGKPMGNMTLWDRSLIIVEGDNSSIYHETTGSAMLDMQYNQNDGRYKFSYDEKLGGIVSPDIFKDTVKRKEWWEFRTIDKSEAIYVLDFDVFLSEGGRCELNGKILESGSYRQKITGGGTSFNFDLLRKSSVNSKYSDRIVIRKIGWYSI